MAAQVISPNLERLSYGGSDGSVATGIHRQVISDGTATRTLLAKESGALAVFDKVDGTVYTLPPAVAGREFTFAVAASITSNSAKVITSAATEFLVGAVNANSLTAGAGDVFQADGTTHRSIVLDATTKGGLAGGLVRFLAISATQWLVTGATVGSGTLVDPFSTS